MPASVAVLAAGAAAATGIALILGSGSQPGGAQQARPERPNCAVTVANGNTPPGENPTPDVHGNGVLLPDGSVGIKAPWWRGPGVRGRVRVRARRLDTRAPRVDRTIPPSGYGVTGFQAMGLELPTTGCRKVTGSVGKASLTYVTLVERAR
jgi:hypothetical protein